MSDAPGMPEHGGKPNFIVNWDCDFVLSAVPKSPAAAINYHMSCIIEAVNGESGMSRRAAVELVSRAIKNMCSMMGIATQTDFSATSADPGACKQKEANPPQ